jgi:hypothetical protein
MRVEGFVLVVQAASTIATANAAVVAKGQTEVVHAST